MNQPHTAQIQAEHDVLDKIHLALQDYPEGRTLEELAESSGFSKGRIQEMLRKSECVLKYKSKSKRWYADWTDLNGWHAKPLSALEKAA